MNAGPAEMERLMTAKEVGAWLGYSADTVYRLARTEGLPCVRMAGRAVKFRRADVQGWLDGRAVVLPRAGAVAAPPPPRPGRPAVAGGWGAELKAAAKGPAR
jgi:excisionase family DNA binding protein